VPRKKARLPTVVELPFGFRIKVHQTSKAYMRKLFATPDDEEPPVACWFHDGKDSAGGTIWLQRCRSRLQKLEDLAHEMIHATTDWGSWAIAKERE
jgi:hypothetical protein